MPRLGSVDSGKMPLLSIDNVNGPTLYFFTILFFYFNTTKARDAVEYESLI